MATKTAKLKLQMVGDPKRLISALGMGVGALGKYKLAVIGVAAAVTAAFVYSAKRALDFEKDMRDVQSIGKFSEKTFDSLGDSVLRMSTRLPQASGDLAKGLYDIYSSGFKGKVAMDILEEAAKGASAGLTTTAVSTKALTGVMNAYSAKTSPDATKMMDIMFRTVDKGVITFEELSQHIGEVTSISAAAKIPFKEVGASIAYMTIKGMGAAQATTSLRRIILSIIKPSTEMKAMLQKMGFATGEAALKQAGLRKVMAGVIENTHGSTTALQKLFPNIRAFKGAAALTAGGIKEMNGFFQEFNHTAGATDDALKQQAKSFDYQWKLLKNQLQALAITTGQVFLPAMKEVVKALRFLVQRLNDMSPTTKKFLVWTLAIGVGLLGAAGAISVFKVAFAALTLNPVLLAIAGSIALITYLMHKFPDETHYAVQGAKHSLLGLAHVFKGTMLLLNNENKAAGREFKKAAKEFKQSGEANARFWTDIYGKTTKAYKLHLADKRKAFKAAQRKTVRDMREQGISEDNIRKLKRKKEAAFNNARAKDMVAWFKRRSKAKQANFIAELKKHKSFYNSLSIEEQLAGNKLVANWAKSQKTRGLATSKYRKANVAELLLMGKHSTALHSKFRSEALAQIYLYRINSGLYFRAARKRALFNLLKLVTLGPEMLAMFMVNGLRWIWNYKENSNRLFNAAKDGAIGAITIMRTVVGGVLHGLVSDIGAVGTAIVGAFDATWTGAYNVVVRALNKIIDIINAFIPGKTWDFKKAGLLGKGHFGGGGGGGGGSGDGFGVGDGGYQMVKGSIFGAEATGRMAYSGMTTRQAMAAHVPYVAVRDRSLANKWINIRYHGRTARVKVTDYGPAAWTGRAIDMSPQVAAMLGYTTDSPLEVDFGSGSSFAGANATGGVAMLDLSGVGGYPNPKNTVERLINATIERVKAGTMGWFGSVVGGVGVAGASIAGILPRVAGFLQLLINKFGLRLTSGFRPGAITESGRRSLHGMGKAGDLAGSWAAMQAAALLAGRFPGAKEVLFNSINWVTGQHVNLHNPHTDHVHVGFAEKGLFATANQAVMVHGGETVLPADITAGLLKLIQNGPGKVLKQTINVTANKPMDFDFIARRMAWAAKTKGF